MNHILMIPRTVNGRKNNFVISLGFNEVNYLIKNEPHKKKTTKENETKEEKK